MTSLDSVLAGGLSIKKAESYYSHIFVSQTVVITGANTGLGFEAATEFSRQGASAVILVSTIHRYLLWQHQAKIGGEGQSRFDCLVQLGFKIRNPTL